MKVGIIHMYPSQYLLETYVNLGHEVYLFSPSDPQLEAVVWQYDPFEDRVSSIERLMSSARYLDIDVFPAVYEGAVEIVAHLSEELQLPNFSVKSAQASRNKYLGYKYFKESNVSVPKTMALELGKNTWTEVSKELGSPIIVKLTDSMNSQGVMKVSSEETYLEAISELTKLIEQPDSLDYSIDRNRVAYGRSDVSIIAQEYVSGTEFSVDLVFKNSKFLNLGIFEKLPPFDHSFVESASMSPPALSEHDQEQLVELAKSAVSAIGANIGTAHVEIMKTDTGFSLIEVGLRSGGGFTTRCIELLYGINSFEALLNVLTDSDRGAILLDSNLCHDGFTMFGGVHYRKSGKIKNIIGVDILSDSALIQEYVLLNDIGDSVLAAPNSSQPHFTYYLIKASSREEALELHHRVQKSIQIDIETK